MTEKGVRRLCAIVVVGVWGAMAQSGSATEPFPVEPYPYPFRSVAGPGDVGSIRFNPAGLGLSEDVEFGYFHKYSGNPTGFNSMAMRAKTFGFSISWLNDAQHGKRREYLMAAGHRFAKKLTLGATFRWLKADDSLLQNKTTWTFAAAVPLAKSLTLAARWENALHTKVADTSTGGVWVLGARTQPFGPKADFSVDWIYPDWSGPGESDLRFAVGFMPTPGINIRSFIDTQERVGLELQVSVSRSRGGTEARFNDFSKYQDGTLYTTVLNRDYPDARKAPGSGQ
jgi:hypothetical protein